SVGPLLPRAGDAGPAPGGAAASRFGGFRLDPAVGNKATGAPMAKSAGSAGDGVQLRLDTASPRLAATRPSEAEQLQRLEAGLAPWVAGSFATRSRQGEAGLSRLLAIETPIDLASREFEAGRLGVRARPVILDSGTPSGRNTLRFGTGALVNGEIDDDEQSANGIAFALDYNIGELSLDVGTTPLGFDVESFVGGLRWLTRPTGALQLTGELSRRAVTDSLLSYAGTTDRLTGVRWGGVVRTGGRVDIAYDLERYGLYASGAYYGLGGRNVDENSMLEFGGGLFFRVLQSRRGGDVTVGLNLTSFGYDRNLRHFTFGHGGYFSPQFFTAVTVPLSWTGRRGRLDYRVDAALGLQTFREDGAPLYPGFPALQDELEEIVEFEPTNDIPLGYESQKVSGLGYKFGATMEYRFNERMSAGGLVSLDNARDYEETVVHFYVRYHFSDRDGTRGAFSTPDLQRGALP
ncbi:MAG TPA: cellulose synthase subunit BcsC-related outer membrane protein, partial [Fontimonas sp.]